MKYNVKATKSSGESYETVIEAVDRAGLYEKMRADGDTALSVEEVKEKKVFSILKFLPFIGKISTREKFVFTRNIGAMLESGLSLGRALAVIQKQNKNKKLKKVLDDVAKNISGGKTFSDSLAEFPEVFSPLVISMVKAGEESGSLADTLKVIANQIESSYTLTKKIKGALMYPSIIVFAMIGIGFFLLTYVVPTLTSTFKELNVALPLTTRFVIVVSDFLLAHMIVSIVIVFCAVFGIYLFSKTNFGQRIIDWCVLRVPVIGTLVKEVNGARTARTLSSLLSSGVDVVIAVQITEKVLQNSYYKEVLREAGKSIQKGEAMSETFSRFPKLYFPYVEEMISVGEETGQLAKVLMGVAVFYETEVDQKTKDMSTIIEPFLMVFIGAVVGFFAVSMISPMYSLVNVI